MDPPRTPPRAPRPGSHLTRPAGPSTLPLGLRTPGTPEYAPIVSHNATARGRAAAASATAAALAAAAAPAPPTPAARGSGRPDGFPSAVLSAEVSAAAVALEATGIARLYAAPTVIHDHYESHQNQQLSSSGSSSSAGAGAGAAAGAGAGAGLRAGAGPVIADTPASSTGPAGAAAPAAPAPAPAAAGAAGASVPEPAPTFPSPWAYPHAAASLLSASYRVAASPFELSDRSKGPAVTFSAWSLAPYTGTGPVPYMPAPYSSTSEADDVRGTPVTPSTSSASASALIATTHGVSAAAALSGALPSSSSSSIHAHGHAHAHGHSHANAGAPPHNRPPLFSSPAILVTPLGPTRGRLTLSQCGLTFHASPEAVARAAGGALTGTEAAGAAAGGVEESFPPFPAAAVTTAAGGAGGGGGGGAMESKGGQRGNGGMVGTDANYAETAGCEACSRANAAPSASSSASHEEDEEGGDVADEDGAVEGGFISVSSRTHNATTTTAATAVTGSRNHINVRTCARTCPRARARAHARALAGAAAAAAAATFDPISQYTPTARAAAAAAAVAAAAATAAASAAGGADVALSSSGAWTGHAPAPAARARARGAGGPYRSPLLDALRAGTPLHHPAHLNSSTGLVCDTNAVLPLSWRLDFPLRTLRAAYRRLYLLKREAVELFFDTAIDPATGRECSVSYPGAVHVSRAVFIALPDSSARGRLFSVLLALRPPRLLPHTLRPPQDLLATQADLAGRWVRRELSNWQYLVALNTLAGRGYSDLAQYMVMPWVIAHWPPPPASEPDSDEGEGNDTNDDDGESAKKMKMRMRKRARARAARRAQGSGYGGQFLTARDLLQIFSSSADHPLLPVLLRDLSKPIGALDPAKKRAALTRYQG